MDMPVSFSADHIEPRDQFRRYVTPDFLVLAAGLLALTIPTMLSVARESWSTEQGAHGPLILTSGLWLLWRQSRSVATLARPGSIWVVLPMLAMLLSAYVLARITQIVEMEALAVYGVLLMIVYARIGFRAVRSLWFPLLYLAFAIPPPDSVLALLTQPLKIAISHWAVSLLYALGYPIGGIGVTIRIAQYELLVAAACAGLNSMITLSSLALFYVYMRRKLEWQYAILLVIIIIPVSIFANFVRVLTLILVTYYSGEAMAQGFLHNFAGLFIFALTMATIFAADELLHPIWRRLLGRGRLAA